LQFNFPNKLSQTPPPPPPPLRSFIHPLPAFSRVSALAACHRDALDRAAQRGWRRARALSLVRALSLFSLSPLSLSRSLSSHFISLSLSLSLVWSTIDETMFYLILQKGLLCAFRVSCMGTAGFWDWIPIEADSGKTAFPNIVQCARSSETSLYSER